MPERKQKRTTYQKGHPILRNIFKLALILIVCLFLLLAGTFVFFMKDLPRPEKFAEGFVAQSSKIYDRSGQIMLYEISGEEKRTFVPLENIPLTLQQAVIATEDKNFYQHSGVDIRAIGRALLHDLKIKRLAQGASTISQQLIRSYFLTAHKTLKRKTRELILTLELERRYPKDQILEWYLNLIPFGSNLYGAESASQTFFQKSVSDISLAQSAILAALIKAPTTLWPYGDNQEQLFIRKDYVLDRMLEKRFITKEQNKEAKQEVLEFSKGFNLIKAPHFVMYAKAYLENKYGREYLERAGLKIITTIDWDLQQIAEQAVSQGAEINKAHNGHNAGLISINPKTGELLAMVGSKDYFGDSSPIGCKSGVDCQFDPQVNVTIALRQPGSAFKPLVYALALDKGFTPETHLWDIPTEFNYYCPIDGSQKKDKYGLDCYSPRNYDNAFKGQITIGNALAQSRNLPSVKVLYLAGIQQTLDFVKKLGINTLRTAQYYGLSLVLGGGEVKLLEMVQAYSVFANDGAKTSLNIIKRIENNQGKTIERAKITNLKVLPNQIARQINNILSDNALRAPVFGWNSLLYLKDYNAAVKTGTTQDYHDAWTVGYTPSLATGVWVGNNDNSPTVKAGVYLAAPIWNNFMRQALVKFPKESFTYPQPTKTGNSVLDGSYLGGHSVLHYLNKNAPLIGGTSQDDDSYPRWEQTVANWLSWH